MGPSSRAVAIVAAVEGGPVRAGRRRGGATTPRGWTGWLGEPRSGVLIVLAAAFLLGGGRKLLRWWEAREAVGRLGDPDLTPEAIERASRHGRAGLIDLFRILGTAEAEALRHAAG